MLKKALRSIYDMLAYLVAAYNVCKPKEYQYKREQKWCHCRIDKTK